MGRWIGRISYAVPSVLAIVFAAPSRAGDSGDEQGPLTDFYSYLPAAPELRIPDINIPFWTDDLKKAKRAYSNGNYDRALRLFRRASDDGNIVADWYLGPHVPPGPRCAAGRCGGLYLLHPGRRSL